MWHLFCLGGAVRSDGDNMYASRLVPLLIQSHALYPCDLCVVMLILSTNCLSGADPLGCYCPILANIVDLFVRCPSSQIVSIVCIW